jgi:hypothetical protein
MSSSFFSSSIFLSYSFSLSLTKSDMNYALDRFLFTSSSLCNFSFIGSSRNLFYTISKERVPFKFSFTKFTSCVIGCTNPTNLTCSLTIPFKSCHIGYLMHKKIPCRDSTSFQACGTFSNVNLPTLIGNLGHSLLELANINKLFHLLSHKFSMGHM